MPSPLNLHLLAQETSFSWSSWRFRHPWRATRRRRRRDPWGALITPSSDCGAIEKMLMQCASYLKLVYYGILSMKIVFNCQLPCIVVNIKGRLCLKMWVSLCHPYHGLRTGAAARYLDFIKIYCNLELSRHLRNLRCLNVPLSAPVAQRSRWRSHPIIRGGQVGGATHAVESAFFCGKKCGWKHELDRIVWENQWEIH